MVTQACDPALGRLRQDDHDERVASLGYTRSLDSKKEHGRWPAPSSELLGYYVCLGVGLPTSQRVHPLLRVCLSCLSGVCLLGKESVA